MINNFIKRFISSIILIPFSLFFVLKGGFFFIFFLILCLLISFKEWNNMIINIYIKLFGFIFLCLSFYCAYQLRIISTDLNNNSFIIILLICIFTDIGAYSFGNFFKGPKISKISPNKTYSGFFGGIFSSLFFLYLFLNFLSFFNNFYFIYDLKNIFYIIFLSIISQIGDFIISFFKRLSKIKDTGHLIPGHGGILDRIDGMIFVFPIALFLENFFR